MKHETKAEQIDRLKKHNTIFWRMPYDDRKLFVDMDEAGDHILVRRGESKLVPKPINESLMALSVYCIPEDYEPEPDTPVFPGYEVCEVRTSGDGQLWYTRLGKHSPIDHAPRYACCGYVCKERLDIMMDRPIAFLTADGNFLDSLHAPAISGHLYKPATLGWVCFKEEVE